MFGRMIDSMRQFFTIVGFITLALGGIGVMNIMLDRREGADAGDRRAQGARRDDRRQMQRQFFLEGFFLTLLSGAIGLRRRPRRSARPSTPLPMPTRFEGMIVTWQAGVLRSAALVLIGVVTATYPARRAAELPPVEALRYEM